MRRASARPEPRVLVVDDDDFTLRFVGRVLTGAGYKVSKARGAAEALRAVRASAKGFSLIISDVIMPNMSGPELVALVVLEAPRLRLLFMTGSAGAERRDAARLGPVLAKPFTGPELLAAVRSAIK